MKRPGRRMSHSLIMKAVACSPGEGSARNPFQEAKRQRRNQLLVDASPPEPESPPLAWGECQASRSLLARAGAELPVSAPKLKLLVAVDLYQALLPVPDKARSSPTLFGARY